MTVAGAVLAAAAAVAQKNGSNETEKFTVIGLAENDCGNLNRTAVRVAGWFDAQTAPARRTAGAQLSSDAESWQPSNEGGGEVLERLLPAATPGVFSRSGHH